MTLSADADTRGALSKIDSGELGLEERGIRVLDLDAATTSLIDSVRAPLAEAGTVAIVGLGYVGLPTALGFAGAGSRVIGLDYSRERVVAIRERRVDLTPSDRERLDDFLPRPEFVLTVDPAALALADAVIVCVPTPVDDHLLPDLMALRSACETVVAHAVAGQMLVLTSTSYVGCTRELLGNALEERGFTVGEDIFVAFSPERIDPGNTRHPQETITRVVGGITPACTRRALELLGHVAPVHAVTSPEAAELTKLYENTFRAVNIALANELEVVSLAMGLDAHEVIAAAATKPFGFMAFQPGTGVGGHCIPCDPHYLLWQVRAQRMSMPVVEHAMAEIAARPIEMVARASQLLSDAGRGLRGSRVLMLGVTYKPGVEDTRESPALTMLTELLDRGADVEYHDPYVPSLGLRDGMVLHSVPFPPDEAYDLVIVHAIQPGVDAAPWTAGSIVLDPGGRTRESPKRMRALGPTG